MQLMSAAIDRLDVPDPFDPERSNATEAKYLKKLLNGYQKRSGARALAA